MEASEEEVQYFVHATNPMSANQIRLEDYLQVTEDTADWWFVTSFGATHLSLFLCTLPLSNQLQFYVLSCLVMNSPKITEEVKTLNSLQSYHQGVSYCVVSATSYPEDSVCSLTALVLSLNV